MKLFDGYVRNYHTFQLNYAHGYTAAASSERKYFTQLGSMLGYQPLTADDSERSKRPMDLAWWDQYDAERKVWKELVLHLEKEKTSRKSEATLEKLFADTPGCQPQYAIGIFQVRKKERIDELLQAAQRMCKLKDALLIIRLKNVEVYAYLLSESAVIQSKKACIADIAGTLYMYFEDEHSNGKTGELKRFYHDDEAYAAWCRENEAAYVYNYFGGSDGQADMNKIHRANCSRLWRKSDEGKRTTAYEKVCAANLDALKSFVIGERGSSWSYCKKCMQVEKTKATETSTETPAETPEGVDDVENQQSFQVAT